MLLAPQVHGDERGFFVETYSAAAWAAAGVPGPGEFVQDNHSRSRRGTVRGLHFQTHPGQGKLVRCARGSVVDVVVDLRRGSPTFGQWESVELDDIEGRQLWIPIGFAHGFCVTSEVADFVYKTTNYYDAVDREWHPLRRSRGRRDLARRRVAVLRARPDGADAVGDR